MLSKVLIAALCLTALPGLAQSPVFSAPNGSASTSSTGPQTFNGAIGATNLPIDISAYGASTALADNSTAIANASIAAAAVGGCVTASRGVFQIQNPVQFAAEASLCLQAGAVIKATASMAAVIETPLGSPTHKPLFTGGKIDANGFAADGLFLQYAFSADISNIYISGSLMHGIHIGSQSAASASNQVNIGKGVQVILPTSITQQSNSISLFFDNATDSTVDVSYLGIGYQIGEEALGSNVILNGHVWGAATQQLSTGFELLGSRDSLGNGWYADTPIVDGVIVSGSSANIGPGICYEGSAGGVDDVANCIHITASGLAPAITGVIVYGSAANLRFFKDVNTPTRAGLSISNVQDLNVANPICGQNNCNLFTNLNIGTGQSMSAPPEMTVYLGTVPPATASASTFVPFTPKSAITITRVEWQLGTKCTVAATLTVLLSGTLQSYTIPVNTTSFSGSTDGTLNVPAGTAVGIETTTAGTTCGTAQMTVHYLMQ